MTTRPTWAALDRAKVEIGSLVSTHDAGLSSDELKARYSGDGGPTLDGFQRFCGDVLSTHLTPQQVEGALALIGSRQVLIQGGQGVGKDTLAACWSLYEMSVMETLVLVSGPTDRQVREVLMRREIGRMWRHAGGKLQGEKYEMAIRLPGREEGGLLAFTSGDPERFVGHHAPGGVFIAVTEGQGVPYEIFEAVQRCQPTRTLVTINPTSPSCAAYGFSRSATWNTLVWSCLDHPNVLEGREVVRGAVNAEWIEAMRAEHGEHSRFWCYAVLAKWPETSESPLIRAEWWDEAVTRDRFFELGGVLRYTPRVGLPRRWRPVDLGIDPAREGGDQTGVVVRQGPVVLQLHRWRETSTVDNARRVDELVGELVKEHGGVGHVVVDEVALGGGVLDELAERLPRHRFLTDGAFQRSPWPVGFKSSRKAGNPARFASQKAECYYHLATLFERGQIGFSPEIDPDLLQALRQELLHHSIEHGADDRVGIAAKDAVRRALGRSPDLADALMQAFVPDVPSGGPPLLFGGDGRASTPRRELDFGKHSHTHWINSGGGRSSVVRVGRW